MKTIQIDNKIFQEVEIAMLESNIVTKGCLMKHPNDKLSIHNDDSGFQGFSMLKPQHLHLLTNEKINEGDWYITIENEVLKCTEVFMSLIYSTDDYGKNTSGRKKIVLTTDQDLITDGVQAIDYDFLNWFIDNSHFTEVEVISELNLNGKNGLDRARFIYKIILPKKETEQIKCYGKFGQELFDGDFVDVQGNGVFQIYKKKDNQLYFKPYGEEEMVYTYFSKDIAKCDEVGNWITNPNIYEYVNEEETLEEENQQSQEIIDRDLAGKKWVFEINGHKWSNNDNTAGDNYGSFIEGAKWQSERSYNQEEVINIFFLGRESLNKALVTKEEALEIIDQFKKK